MVWSHPENAIEANFVNLTAYIYHLERVQPVRCHVRKVVANLSYCSPDVSEVTSSCPSRFSKLKLTEVYLPFSFL